MAKPQTELPKNSFRKKEEAAQAQEPKAERNAPSFQIPQFSLGDSISFLKSERFLKISGLVCIVLAAYLAIAFTSFLFTWRVDQSEVMADAATYLNPETTVSNWLGKLGAWVAHVFLHQWFGVSSYIVALFLCVLGVRLLFKINLLPLGKTFRYSLFMLFWSSLFLGFLFSTDFLFLGGGIGYRGNLVLWSLIGKAGTGILIGASMLGFLIVAINIRTDWFSSWGNASTEDETEDVESKETFNSENPTANRVRYTPPAHGQDALAASSELSAIQLKEEEEVSLPEEEEDPALLNEFENAHEGMAEVEEAVETAIPDTWQIEEHLPDELEELESDQEITPELESPVQEVSPEMEFLQAGIELSPVPASDPTANKPDNKGEVEFEIEQPVAIESIVDESEVNQNLQAFGEYDPTLELASYQLPPLDLLEQYGNGKEINVNAEELNANKDRIVQTLKHYNINIDKIKATIGPTVTLYEIVPEAGVRISKIKNLEDDIALSLSALGIRIIAPIPGKGTIGIEVPNLNPEMVPMRSILASDKFQNTSMDLPIALGKTISNETFIADLSKMPHLLMAGATGQGKSVGLNAILVSLLYKKHPSQVKFVLVDPKKVELTLFNKIERHFLAKLPDAAEAIITDNKQVIHTLNSLCVEMDKRYDLLKDAQVRNIKEYNAKFIARRLNPEKGHKFLPYIVLVVDEFADLIMTAGKEVEMPIARLAQLARAIGIHLIIATQRPSVNIITGTIKANFPARIAFRVTSKIDSRTILDAGGADQLIGRGDMLLSTGSDLIRLQCAFVDTPEVDKITEYIGAQRSYPDAFLLPEYIDENSLGDGKEKDFDASSLDALFNDAARIVVQHQQGSASLLQRKLKLGFNRAGRIIDQLEASGIIGPFEGSKAREVLIKDPMSLEQLLTKREN